MRRISHIVCKSSALAAFVSSMGGKIKYTEYCSEVGLLSGAEERCCLVLLFHNKTAKICEEYFEA